MTDPSTTIRPVRAYWWRPMTGTIRQRFLDLLLLWTSEGRHRTIPPWRLRNFGDELTPVILDVVVPGIHVTHVDSRHAELTLLGSVLHRAADESPWHSAVIGAGIPGGLDVKALSRVRCGVKRLDIRAVRGPMTVEALNLPRHLPMGDPALVLRSSLVEGQRKGGILVVHYGVAGSPRGRQAVLTQAERLNLDVVSTASPLAQVITKVNNASFVLSTSLHGLILADVAGVPAMPVTMGSVTQRDFRFEDYAATVGRKHVARMPISQVGPAEVEGIGGLGRSLTDNAMLQDSADAIKEALGDWLTER